MRSISQRNQNHVESLDFRVWFVAAPVKERTAALRGFGGGRRAKWAAPVSVPYEDQ